MLFTINQEVKLKNPYNQDPSMPMPEMGVVTSEHHNCTEEYYIRDDTRAVMCVNGLLVYQDKYELITKRKSTSLEAINKIKNACQNSKEETTSSS